MKRVIFVFSLSLFVLQTNAQDQTINGTTFKQDGKVGIGAINPNHELTIEGASSPNIELKNSNYSNGGFILNRTNYGNQWKWWAQSNVMYFGFATDETNFSNKLTIKSNGKVGIGTTSPSAKLHITDQGTSGVTSLQLNNRIKFRGDGVMEWGASSNQGILSWDTGRAVIGAKGGQDLSLYANYSEKMRINQNGNIGIGTTTPSSKLEIKDATNNQLSLVNSTGNLWQFRAGSSGSLIFKDDNIERIRIDALGNVGIGTTTPDAKLAVNGNIHTKEVKVDLLGAVAPDYVFYKDYDLKTLTEVENFITKEGHLPNIPSAKEMEANGIYLKDMNLKLLEKIEELTLYTIQQQKQIDILINKIIESEKNKID